MAVDHLAEIEGYLGQSLETLRQACASEAFKGSLAEAARALASCLQQGGKIMLCGNGGSAADAQHVAGEFLSRLAFDRAPLPAIALTVDTSVITAVANDYGYEQVFARQIRGLGREGDALMAISTSGTSPSILAAAAAAKELGITVIGLTGSAQCPLAELSDIVIAAPSRSTPLIQQIHIVAAHILCGLVERELFGDHGAS